MIKIYIEFININISKLIVINNDPTIKHLDSFSHNDSIKYYCNYFTVKILLILFVIIMIMITH